MRPAHGQPGATLHEPPQQSQMADNSSSLRHSLVEKVVFPTVTAILSSVIIGAVLSLTIDSQVERWKTIGSLQINREQQAQIELYDAFENASLKLANYYWRTGNTKQQTYDAIDTFGDTFGRHSAFIPEELEDTYTFLDYELLIGARLVTKDRQGTISKEEIVRAEQSKERMQAAEHMLRTYIRAWHAGETRKANRALHDYFEKYVKSGLEEADEYSTKLLQAESPESDESAID